MGSIREGMRVFGEGLSLFYKPGKITLGLSAEVEELRRLLLDFVPSFDLLRRRVFLG